MISNVCLFKISIVDSHLEEMKPPDSVTRRPRPINENVHHLKGTNFEQK